MRLFKIYLATDALSLKGNSTNFTTTSQFLGSYFASIACNVKLHVVQPGSSLKLHFYPWRNIFFLLKK